MDSFTIEFDDIGRKQQVIGRMKFLKSDRKYLIASWAIWYVGDIVITLYGQPLAYWSNGYEQADEANAVAKYALEHTQAILLLVP